MTTIKAELCKDYIKEANRIILAMQSLIVYCSNIIKNEEQEDLGDYVGDGFNDPENLRTQKRNEKEEMFMEKVVKPAFYDAATNNTIIRNVEDNIPDSLLMKLRTIEREQKQNQVNQGEDECVCCVECLLDKTLGEFLEELSEISEFIRELGLRE